MVIYGGVNIKRQIQGLKKGCDIVVATPGRLKDHLLSTKLKGGRPFIDTIQNLQTLVVDETDRLLDLGFRRDVQDIRALLIHP